MADPFARLLGALTFDPLAFTRLDEKKQFETLRRFVPDVDFDAIERANKADYDKRTDVNRRAKEARTRGEAIRLPAGDLPARQDVDALVEHLEGAGRTNAEIEARKVRREQAGSEAARLAGEAVALRIRARKLRQEADEADAQAAEKEAENTAIMDRLGLAEPLPELVDTSAVRQKIATARETNARLDQVERERAERERLLKEAADFEAQSEAFTAAMKKREGEKLAAIAAAKMPVEGLSFGEGVVLLNGLPFDQASSAEQLRASVAIAMAMNSGLRVIRVQDGSLLDEDSMRVLADMADEADCQVWIERVDSSGKVGIVLEDGHVRAPLLQAAE